MRDTIHSFPYELALDEEEPNVQKVFDPRFVLPLLFHQISPQNLVNCHQFVELKGLFYTLAALSSSSLDIRKLAYSILTRFYCQLESSTFYKDRLLWMSFLDNLRCGVKEDNEQLPRTVTMFLTAVIEVLMTPDHFMSDQLRKFMTQVTQFDGDNILKFLISLIVVSDTKKHLQFSEWSLKLLAESVSTDMDFRLCHEHKLFSLIMELNQSQLSILTTKKLFLDVMTKTLMLETAAKTLSMENGLSQWLLLEVLEVKRKEKVNDEYKASLTKIVTQVCSIIVKSYKRAKKQLKRGQELIDENCFAHRAFEEEMLFVLNCLKN
jgi:nucleolar pre-ribosomal-associated protein 1